MPEKKTGKAPKKAKPSPPAVPSTLQEVEVMERRIAELAGEIEAAKAQAEAEKARIDSELKSRVDPLRDSALALVAQVYAYAETNRAALTEGGKSKTAHLGSSGRVEWEMSPAAVKIRGEAKLLETLKSLGPQEFLRYPPPEIDRDAMLKDQERAKLLTGVTISQDEKVRVRLAHSRAFGEATLGKKGTPGTWAIKWPKDEEKGEEKSEE